ncbi:ThiF family adenylyltransferase [Parapedobacter deserti]|uniref:ThiF family adenylyltransferase n=1 Tax=Parapedobacter deserti TaxID=1912957 RepID=A0ABV7JQS1_9SPHI
MTNQRQETIDYKPIFFRLRHENERQAFDELLRQNPEIRLYDTIKEQLGELARISFPGRTLSEHELNALIFDWTKGFPLETYGVWVYFPWNRNCVHLLEKEEFVKLRTNRNVYKIDFDQVDILRTKKIGIIGLSVGQSIALTMAMERVCGEIRLADFDEIELSNMNRIRVGVQDLGVNKAIVAARQIAEMDPFINVVCYTLGVNDGNIDDFFQKDGKIDVLVEECDSIDVKIFSRLKARSLNVPVVMDTNDRGMLDVERFDREPDRPILHGTVEDLERLPTEQLVQKLRNLTIGEKVNYLSNIIGIQNVSKEMLRSLEELNKTIVGWPQLASAVVLGGAMVTDTCRRILLGEPVPSGRYFVDFEELIRDPASY